VFEFGWVVIAELALLIVGLQVLRIPDPPTQTNVAGIALVVGSTSSRSHSSGRKRALPPPGALVFLLGAAGLALAATARTTGCRSLALSTRASYCLPGVCGRLARRWLLGAVDLPACKSRPVCLLLTRPRGAEARNEKGPVSRAFLRADDGTRTHDLLHGKRVVVSARRSAGVGSTKPFRRSWFLVGCAPILGTFPGYSVGFGH
jgi:hypothetical protein